MALKDRAYESDFLVFVRDVSDGHRLDPPAAGIALQALDKGVDSLSSAQLGALAAGLEPYYRERCDRCSGHMPWGDMLFAYDEAGGLCSYCYHVMTKDD